MHHCIIHYVDAYVQDTPFQAAVYMEWCDRGTLRNLINVYNGKRRAGLPDRIPESFIWHCFTGLADALGYLQTGKSHIAPALATHDTSNWTSLVHRDIKPDNVFIRSRDSLGSTKPFYVLLSDFGLMAPEEKITDPQQMVSGFGQCGTPEFYAPELCFDPIPTLKQMNRQRRPHSPRSDVWAVAAVMFGMCQRDELAFLDKSRLPLRSQRALGRAAKLTSLDITDVGFYSDYLARTIQWAGLSDHTSRPDGWQLTKEVAQLYSSFRSDPNWQEYVNDGQLPDWATKKATI
ncbi:kinase-like domain-containing protein [Xylariaceae sp. FL0016]|nr:kinase-like domain-containing protein [Xylariaceae sp. FL0016]